MKKQLQNLLLATGLLTAGITIAQPTLTATGINVAVGDALSSNYTNYLSQGAAGANQTWDLSAFTTSSTGTLQGVTPSSTPNSASFPTANVCESYVGLGAYIYNKTSASAWQIVGNVTPQGSSPVVMPYSDPEDILHFPFTYNNSYTDTWAATFTSAGSNYTRTGTDSIKADGYGTLKLPSGTYSNVLRVHFVQNYVDNANIGGTPFTITYRNDEYMWYLNGNHYPLASVSSLSTDYGTGPSVSQTGYFLNNIVAGIKNVNETVTQCNLFPNPASNNLTLNLGLTENKKVEVKLFNSIGEQLSSTVRAEGVQGDNSYTLDVAALPSGIYFAQINLDGTLAATKRFVVTK